MKCTLPALLLASSSLATPVIKKRYSIQPEDDTTMASAATNILQYALTLEHLEATFYRQGVANFTAAQFTAAGFGPDVYTNLQRVNTDETAHVTFLSTVLTSLGQTPTAECIYSFPYTDPKSFVTLATVLEGVGVSAYLGAAADIASPDYLTAAGSILTTEARHASYLRAQVGEAPFTSPYDTPLDYDQVYSLASPFFVSCPSTNPTLPLKAFPKVAVTTTGTVNPGSTISFTTPGSVLVAVGSDTVPLYAAWLQPEGVLFAPVTKDGNGGYTTTVPSTLAGGQSYMVLTNCGDRVTDDTTLAGPGLVEVVATN